MGGQKGIKVYSCVLRQKMLKIRDQKNGEESENKENYYFSISLIDCAAFLAVPIASITVAAPVAISPPAKTW